jgi:dihydrofolate synthase/folylpolyglutamate synthase
MRGQLRALLPLFQSVIATQYQENPRAVPPEDVSAAVLELSGLRATIAAEPAGAVDLARRRAGSGGLVCVTGSLFLAAEARSALLGVETVRPRAAAPH